MGRVKTTGHVKKRRRRETWSVYVYRVLKQVHPEMGISRKAMQIMNSACNDWLDKICLEGARLARYNKRRTLGSREVQSAV
jgi:histone H2B